ncbi:MAG: phosphoenolpyruvate--protein phosphotransferase [Clostridia bacterium]
MEYNGTVVSKGIAIGKAFVYSPYVPQISQEIIENKDKEAERARYRLAHKKAANELDKLLQHLSNSNPEQVKIFKAHLDILDDESMTDEILDAIDQNMNAAKAVDLIYTQYAEIISSAKNALLAERAADMRDVGLRLLRCLEGKPETNLASLNQPVVLVTHDLLPSDSALLDASIVQGIVTEVGGTTSHSAIIARSYGIPALTGVENICQTVQQDEYVIVDGIEGRFLTDADSLQINQYHEEQARFARRQRDDLRYLNVEPCTTEGTRIRVLVNIGSADEREFECAPYVDGVGLFRTEFLYMGRKELPSEEEQYQFYKKVFEAFSPNPVTLRTLDIGGDKKAPCLNLPQEENPFLGNRALRLCFDRNEIFTTQLRAVLRASVHGNLKLMFPMVSSIEDIRKAKDILKSVQLQLDEQNIPWNRSMQVGTMIEIPALAVIADLLADEVDFASIGTNDLTQYTLATDRINPSVSEYYQPFNPALIRLLKYTIQEFNKAGKQISVCGEMGGDPIAATALLGMGILSLSMGKSSIPEIKKLICTLNICKAKQSVNQLCSCRTAAEIRNNLSAIDALDYH